MKYLVVFEPTARGFSAYSPNLPGFVATGATGEVVEREITNAIAFHIEGLRLEGFQFPNQVRRRRTLTCRPSGPLHLTVSRRELTRLEQLVRWLGTRVFFPRRPGRRLAAYRGDVRPT